MAARTQKGTGCHEGNAGWGSGAPARDFFLAGAAVGAGRAADLAGEGGTAAGAGSGGAGGAALAGNALWAVLGNVFYAAGRFLIVVLLTRGFASAQVGQVLYGLAVVTPLGFLINLELRSVYVTDPRGWAGAGHCLGVRLASNVLLAAVLAGLCGLNYRTWGGHKVAIILLVGLVRMAESWADVYLGVLQKHERMKNWAVSQAIKTVLVLAWAAALARWVSEIAWFLAGWLAVTAGVAWAYDRRQAGRWADVRPRWDGAVSGRLVRSGLPLGVFVTLASCNQYVGQYFIQPALGDAAVAHFAALLNVVSGLAAVQNGINQAVLARLARYYVEGARRFRRLLGAVLGVSWLGAGLLVGAVWWKGAAILRVLYGQEYVQFAPQFTIVAMAGWLVLTSMTLGDAVVACQRYKSRMIAVGIGVAVNGLLSGLLVGHYGLYGPAWAVVASGGMISLYCAGVLRSAGRSRRAAGRSGAHVEVLAQAGGQRTEG